MGQIARGSRHLLAHASGVALLSAAFLVLNSLSAVSIATPQAHESQNAWADHAITIRKFELNASSGSVSFVVQNVGVSNVTLADATIAGQPTNGGFKGSITFNLHSVELSYAICRNGLSTAA